MTCPNCNCGGGTPPTFCDFLRSGGLNGYYAEIGLPLGIFTNQDDCDGCEGVNGNDYQLCCDIVYSGNPSEGTQYTWISRYTFSHILCPQPWDAISKWFQIWSEVRCLDGVVTIYVSLNFAHANTTPGLNCTFHSPNATYKLTLSEEDFEAFIATPLAELEVPLVELFVGPCEVDIEKTVKFRLIESCGTTTTTTTTPRPWWCLAEFGDTLCEGPTGCLAKSDAELIEDCITLETCEVCDGPFTTEAECIGSTYCPTTTTTTTTTTPDPLYYCCGQVGDDCYGTVDCSTGGPCELREPARPDCGDSYATELECLSGCTSLTTTTCGGDPMNECENNCIMACIGGLYSAPLCVSDCTDCFCVPSAADLALVGTACTDARGGIPMCNICPESEFYCTTTTPAP